MNSCTDISGFIGLLLISVRCQSHAAAEASHDNVTPSAFSNFWVETMDCLSSPLCLHPRHMPMSRLLGMQSRFDGAHEPIAATQLFQQRVMLRFVLMLHHVCWSRCQCSEMSGLLARLQLYNEPYRDSQLTVLLGFVDKVKVGHV